MYPLIKTIFNDFSVSKKAKKSKLSFSDHIEEIGLWLDDRVHHLEVENPNFSSNITINGGRIFESEANEVVFVTGNPNLCQISDDKLTVKSQSSFITVRGNCGVYSGLFMYEVQLHSKGVMQIGWCSKQCQFSQENLGTGVGDTEQSYGYDGSKMKIWHLQAKKYGNNHWRTGDIIGVCLNMNEGQISYYRNGRALGVAFSDIPTGKGYELYPAVSLAFHESLRANFGQSPFRFPIPQYAPLQEHPKQLIAKCECLLGYLSDLSQYISKMGNKKKDIKLTDGSIVSTDAALLVFGSMIIVRLASLLQSDYIIEAIVFNYLKSMCIMRSIHGKAPIQPGSEDSTLGSLLTLLWDHMDFDDMKHFLNKLVLYIESVYKEISGDSDYEKQRSIIVILTCLCKHSRTRKYFLSDLFFRDNCLAIFLYIKPPEEEVLQQIISDDKIWTASFGGNKENYLKGCEQIRNCTSALYNLQKNLLRTLLNNDDFTEKTPSSRKIFVTLFRKFVFNNCLEHRMTSLLQGNVHTPTQPAIGLAFIVILLDLLKEEMEKEHPKQALCVNTTYFYDGTLSYKSMDRVGGIISYLRKVHRHDLMARLGVDHQSFSEAYEQQLVQAELNDLYSSLFVISGSPSTGFSITTQTINHEVENAAARVAASKNHIFTAGAIVTIDSIHQMIDTTIIFYFVVAHKYIAMIAELRDTLASLKDVMNSPEGSQERLNDVALGLAHENISHNTILEPRTQVNEDLVSITQSRMDLGDIINQKWNFYNKRATQLARKQAWYRAVALSEHRRDLLSWLIIWVFQTSEHSSNEGTLFTFLPEIYINIMPMLLDTVMDFSFYDIQEQYDLTNLEKLLEMSSNFLARNVSDSRIILASCKDALIQSLGVLACHERGIICLENIQPENQLTMVNSLLRPYENRAWGQSNWLLLRFWLGDGFMYRESRPANSWNHGEVSQNLGLSRRRAKSSSYTGLLHFIAPARPSTHYQQIVGQVLMEDGEYCAKFLNSLLGQLNWAFSEFIHTIQEVQTLLNRKDDPTIDLKQLKICSMCFELTISLMRTLEMIINIVPDLFENIINGSNSDILLNRICQVIVQVLTRTTIPFSAFQSIVDANLSELNHVTHFAILSATLGIFIALMKNEMGRDDCMVKVPKVSRIFLTDPGFHIACLQFTLGQTGVPPSLKDIPRGNFNPFLGRAIESETLPSTATLLAEDPIDTAPTDRERDSSQVIPKFDFRRYVYHATDEEVEKVKDLIKILQIRQSLLSEITVFSEESLCPICCARKNNSTFEPCHHQSCENCIIQHLMNFKVCFYCKAFIVRVVNVDGRIVFEAPERQPSPPNTTNIEPPTTANNDDEEIDDDLDDLYETNEEEGNDQ